MKSHGNLFISLDELAYLDETAIVGKTVRIRKPDRVKILAGAIIDDFTYISCGLRVGCFTHIGANSVLIGGDAEIRIGHFVNIAPGCRLIAASNDFSGGGLSGAAIPSEYAADSIVEDIDVADHVLLGTNVVVLPGTRLPIGLAAGALTLLSSSMALEPWTVYAGIPAKPIKKRKKSEILKTAKSVMRDHPGLFQSIPCF